jgi:F-type H+-transporting ATPase subunit a
MAEIEPMKQFMVQKLLPLPPVEVPGVGALDLSITNTVLYLLIAAALITLFFLSASKRAVVPGRMQALAEMLYDMVDNGLTGAMIGDKGRPFLPFIFTLFSMIAIVDVIGVIPLSFTATSQLAVTATLGILTFCTVVGVGFARNGIGFFKLFWPSGLHPIMAVFIALIELLSFLVRPMTLALRLFGNMMAGHVMLYLFATFVALLGLFAMHGGLASLGLVGSALSLTMIVGVLGLEIAVALIQAFVFATLACVYLNEVVNLGHGH